MFKVLDLKNEASAQAREIGQRYSPREEALIAIKKHLKTFNCPDTIRRAIIGGYRIPTA